MLPVLFRCFVSKQVNVQSDSTEISPTPSTELKILAFEEPQTAEPKKTEEVVLGLDFINYIGNRKINDLFDKKEAEFKEVLYDWFISLKQKTKQKILPKNETANLLNIFSIYIAKLWQTSGYLSIKVNTPEDLKQALFKETKFQESVWKAIKNNNQSEIRNLLNRGLIYLEDGVFYSSMKGAPIYNILTFFLVFGEELNKRFENPDIKDLQLIFEYYFGKIAPEFQNFDLKSPMDQHYLLFVSQFSTFMERKGLIQIYKKTIANINADVEKIRLRKTVQELREIMQKNKEKELAQLLKNHVAEQSSIFKEELQNRKKVYSEYNSEFINTSKLNVFYTSDFLSKEICNAETKEFQGLIANSFLETKKIHSIKLLEKLDKFFSKTIEKIKLLPKNLESLKNEESEERKKLFSDATLEAQQIRQSETAALELVKIRMLQKKRFTNLGNYFVDKLKYSTAKDLPAHLKIPLIENSEINFRNFLEIEYIKANNELLFEKAIDLFQREEASKREEISVQSEFSPVKVHTPYGGSPLRMKISDPDGYACFLKV